MHLTDEYPANTVDAGCFICKAPKRTSGSQSYHDGGELLINLDVLTDIVEDLDRNMHGAKAPVLCETCIRQMADMIGCAAPEEAARLLTANQSMAARLADYENMEIEYEILKETLAKVRVQS